MPNDRAQILITAVDQTRSAFDSVRANLANLGDQAGKVRGLLAGLGVSLSLAGFTAMIKSAIDAADQINKLSQKIGISVEALSTLRFAAQLSDVSLETLQKGIKGLSQSIVEASTGVGDGATLFQALGLSAKNADGSLASTEAVLLKVAEVFANLEDGAVKTALAVKLFGKSGLDLIPFLNQGAAGIRQLTAEAERLGLKLTTETARSAEAFNDNLTALKASSSSLGISLARDFLPELTNITNAMREAANEAGTLKALWVGLGGLGNLVFNGTEIKQARDEIKRIQELVDSTRQKVDSGKAPVPFLPFDVKFNEGAMAILRRNLAQWEKDLAAAQGRLKSLTEPVRPEAKPPTGKPTEDMQRIACVVSGGQWVGGQCVKPGAGKAKDTTGEQLAVLKAEAESEFEILKAGLDLQQAALERALDDRLVSLHDYYRTKTQIEQQAIDQEREARQKELAAQATVAVSGKDESVRLKAKAEVSKLEAELIILNQRRAEVEIANAHQAATAERALRDELARVRDELLDLTGESTAEDRRAAVQRQFQPLLDKLRAEGDQAGQTIVTRLIDVKTASADLAALERDFRSTVERMQLAEASLDRQRASGLLTETQARERILALHGQTADQLDALMPRMAALDDAIGPEAGNRVAKLRDEIAGLRAVSNDAALALEGSFKDGLAGLFKDLISGTKSASQAVGDLGRHVLSTFLDLISRKLANKLFDSLLGGSGGGGSAAGGGIGLFGGLAGLLGIKFAEGGFVTGPGSGTSDSIAARLSDGEYVIRSAAVRRVGVAFLDAVNHLDAGPLSPRPVRPVFAQGGLVSGRSQAAPPVQLDLRIAPEALHLSLRDWLDGELARMAATR